MTNFYLPKKLCHWDFISHRVLLTLAFCLLLAFIPHLVWFTSLPQWYPWKRYLLTLPALFILLCPSCLPGKFGKAWLIGVYILCVPLAVLEALHCSIFDTSVASETLFAWLDTSTTEAFEAISSYFTMQRAMIVLMAFILPFIPLYFLLKLKFSGSRKNIIYVVCLMLISTFFIPEMYKISMLGRISASLQECWQYKTAMHEYTQSTDKHVVVPVSAASVIPQTVIVVIGESATRHHLGIYGYHRPTTPILSAMRDELLLFTDMISRYGFTSANISAMLTVPLGKKGADAPAIELFRKAGMQTFWISNHSTFQVGKGLFHLLYAADQLIPVNPDSDLGVPLRYDGRMLPVLDSILEKTSDSGQRLIFMNIMGSHVKYHSRYPESFSHFISTDDIPDAPWRDEKAKAMINAYDNSILYTDYILGEIVTRIRDIPGAALVYVSDHGQEVYDTLDQMGHGAALTSRYFVDIPFVLWLSPSFRDMRPHDVARWQTYTDRPGVSDCLPSVLADICGISYEDPRRSHNVLSVEFAPEARISLGEAYDAKFFGSAGLYSKDFVSISLFTSQ